MLLPVILLGLACATTGTAPAPTPSPPTDRGTADLPVMEIPHLSQRALLLMLVDRQMYEPAAVERILAEGPELRERLAEALGQIGDPRAVEPLRGMTLDDDPRVRRAAVFALGELESEGARRALLRAVGDDDRETGRLAVEALAKLGTPVIDVADALEGLDDFERWARLLPSLFRFREHGKVTLAEAGLEIDDPELHAWAAYALARDPRPETPHSLLRRLLDDPNPWVRGWGARALGQMSEGDDLDRLTPLLDDEEPGPVIQALRAGRALVSDGRAAPDETWRNKVTSLLDDPRVHVRLTALEVAGAWLLDEALGDALVARAEGAAGEAWERAPALVALARGDHPRAADLIRSFARSDDPDLRAAAATAAAALGDLATLDRLTHDPEPRVRISALEGLLAGVPGGPQPAEVAEESLTDTDPGVRATLFSWLTENPVAPVESLGEPVVQSLTDRNPESSLAGVRALAARAQAEPLERGTLVAVLENLAQYRDWLVRQEAARALAELGRTPPAVGTHDTGHSVEVYESILRQTARPRTVELVTSRGPVRLRLDCPEAPLTCRSLLSLADQGFFDGLTFHRVVPDFVVQGGDPRGDGFGGPSFTIRDEIHRHRRYDRGVLGMALAGPDTGGSQFFVTLSPQPHLDGGYTAFGQVVSGFDVLERIVPGDRIETVRAVASR